MAKHKKTTAEKIAEKKAQFGTPAPATSYIGESRTMREIAFGDFAKGLSLEKDDPEMALSHFRRAVKLLNPANWSIAYC